MPNIYDLFKTNNNLESEQGIILNLGEFKINILRAGKSNKKYTLAFKEYSRPYEKQIFKGILDDDIAEDIIIKTYAKAIVIGWEGIKDENGKDLPYSRENCIKILKDLPELFALIKEEAEKFSNFQEEKTSAKKK